MPSIHAPAISSERANGLAARTTPPIDGRTRRSASSSRNASGPPGGTTVLMSLIVGAPLEEHELSDRDRGEHHEEHHREGCGVRRVPEPEADLEDVVEQE